jgi:hypothetical protein
VDYQEIGRKLQTEWIETWAKCKSNMQVGGELHHHISDPHFIFFQACQKCAQGDKAELIELLQSDQPLPHTDYIRRIFANLLQGKYDRVARRGRPRDEKVHTVAYTADKFYREWRERCLAAGVNHYGKANAMKAESIRFATEFNELKLSEDELEKVYDLMDSPKTRREQIYKVKDRASQSPEKMPRNF